MTPVRRPEVRAGYDQWADTYDRTPNPLVALDRRFTIDRLQPRSNERILDAGCGTGANMRTLRRAGVRATGLDFSLGMLRIAQHVNPAAQLVQADLNARFPLQRQRFDAIVCSLVSEHLKSLRTFFSEAYASLRPGGRMVFAAFHPLAAQVGVEANFHVGKTQYRLGAEPHTVADYLQHIEDAGFHQIQRTDHTVDADIVREVPKAGKYLDLSMLLLIDAIRS